MSVMMHSSSTFSNIFQKLNSTSVSLRSNLMRSSYTRERKRSRRLLVCYTAEVDFSSADFKIQIVRQGSLYIAYSHVLDISTTGKSKEQAVLNMSGLVQVFVREVVRIETERPGALHHKLIEQGWTKRLQRWTPPRASVEKSA